MARLGISIYPEHSDLQEDIAYIKRAGRYGFKRIFTCLLSVEGKSRESVIEEFRARADAAHEAGLEIIADVSPSVFEKLGVSLSLIHIWSFPRGRPSGIQRYTDFTTRRRRHSPEDLACRFSS